MNRRQLLFAGLGWFGTAACGCAARPSGAADPPAPRGPMTLPPPRSVIVIGAGLAGLATADALVDAGFEVVVLEAQQRVGGRILTLRAPFSEGLQVEAGATHVVGDPDLLSLMRKVGVEPTPRKRLLRPAFRVSYLAHTRTVLPTDAPDAPDPRISPEERELGERGRTEKFLRFGAEIDPRALDSTSPLTARHEGRSMADLLRERGASPGYIEAIGEQYVPDHDAEEVSALFVLRDIESIRREIAEPGGGRVMGGLDQFPQALAKGLGGRVILGAEVQRIERRPGSTHVRFSRAGEVHELSAARVVCAIPYAVLRGIEVTPAFGVQKTRAIRELPNASVTRTFVEVADRVWEARGESGRADTDLSIGIVRDETAELAPDHGAILGSYLSGAAARTAAKKDEATRIREAVADLELVHPGAGQAFVRAISRSWELDPFARGGYAWFRPGQIGAWGSHFCSPEGSVHFAGDHTSYRPGFMHGAVASAKRVVEEIVRATR